MNLNKVFIIGRITSDIVLKVTQTNQPVATVSVATNRVWTDKSGQKQEEAEFHNVVIWGRQAELASQFLSKGSLVMIEGRLRTRTWKDNNNQNHRVTEIICERIQFGPRSSNQGLRNAQSYQTNSNQIQQAENLEEISQLQEEIPQIDIEESLEDEIKPEDLPF
jgi:single-strand DNA-binding protein